MYTYVHVHVRTCTRTYMYVRTCTYVYMYVRTCTRTYMYVRVHVRPFLVLFSTTSLHVSILYNDLCCNLLISATMLPDCERCAKASSMHSYILHSFLLSAHSWLVLDKNSPILSCDISNFWAFSEKLINIDAISATCTCFGTVAKSISCETLWHLWERASTHRCIVSLWEGY